MKPEIQHKVDLMHAKLPAFKKKVAASLELIRTCTANKMYVAVSGGKDSTVMLDLVRTVAPATPAIFSDDEWMLPETETYLEQVTNLTRIASPAWHSYFFVSNKKKRDDIRWIEGAANNSMQTYARQKYDCAMIGLRKDESSKRRIHIRVHGDKFTTKAGMTQCYPLANWTTDDIWAYIRSEGIGYNKAYDKMSAMGLPRHEQRVGPFAVEAVLGYGQMVILKKGWTDMYNRFAAEYPEARQWI